MKTRTLIFAWIFIGISCICGMCSKNGNNAGDNGYTEPTLSPDSTWLYMTSNLPAYYVGNTSTRPADRKWIATKITAQGIPNLSDATHDYLSFVFENTDKDTRFISDALNPGGKETMEISVKNFGKTPGTGSYTMDVDYKEGFSWFNIYKANGDKFDSTRTQGFDASSLDITKMTLYASGGGVSIYKMSGTINFEVMYFPSGTSSTSNVHTMSCTFNNVLITYTN